jgi:crotonobetainyl-CoA:carnitine CoA-transferase CaiB-like acyl-CoA transferase
MQLEGIRVVDLTRILAGPFCSMFLADMGADVVKVEDPEGGDPIRSQGEGARDGMSPYFASFNRNKRSIALDLRSDDGRAVLRRLIGRADVLVENYRPGVLDRMGFGRDALREIRPDLVIARVTGYGMDGPYAQRPAFDFIAQAMSGFMSVTGEPDGPPMRAGPPISDLVAGAYAAMGVLAALVRRDRTGRGEEVSTALTDSMVSLLAYLATNWFAARRRPQRSGNDHGLVAPYGLFEAADGRVAIAPSNDAVYAKLLAALGLDHLRERPEFATNADRFARRAAINAEVDAVTRTRPIAHWIDVLNAAGVPCGKVLDVGEVFDDPQIVHQRMRITVEVPGRGPMDVLGFPIRFTDDPCRVHRPPPALGGDMRAVLAELGYRDDEIERLARGAAAVR